MTDSRKEVENLVIGGGLAGASVGFHLAAAGREVVLVEREAAPSDKVCGEFLSVEAVAYLRQAGVDPVALGAAAIHKLRLSCGDRVFETQLPFAALSLSRRVLDSALLEKASQAGCQVRRGLAVQSVRREEGQWVIVAGGEGDGRGERTSDRAQTVWLATGKHDLRGWARPAGRQNDLVGFKMHLHLATDQVRSLCDWMELFLFPGGYGGLSLVEGDVANLCLVIRRADLRRAGNWKGILAGLRRENPSLDRRLCGARAAWQRPLAISSIPYGYLGADSSAVWPVGDQAAVIPSFTGDGMAIALHSAALAAATYLSGKSIAAYQSTLRAQLRGSVSLATTISSAIVTPAVRGVAPLGLRLMPGALNWIARLTRIPERALLSEVGATAR